MTTRLKAVLALTVLVLLCVASIVWNVDWDARAINQQLNKLAELVEKSQTESSFEAMGRARRVGNFFTDACEIEYLPQRSSVAGADSIQAVFLSARNSIQTVSVRLSQHSITVNTDAERAESTVRAVAKVAMRGGDQWGDVLNYRIAWEQIDGEWLIQQIWITGER